MIKQNLILICISLVCFACETKTEKQGFSWDKCKFGKPEPIFGEPNLPGIKSKTFAITQQEGLEVVNFSDSLQTELSIRQSGCDELSQEFTFTYKGKNYGKWDDESWKKQAVMEFVKLSNLSPRLFVYSKWASAIYEQRDSINIGENRDLAQGHFLKINKLAQADQGQLIITLSGKRE